MANNVISIAETNQKPPDYILETQLACQAAAVIACHFSRPRGEVLSRILAEIPQQVAHCYSAAGIEQGG